MPVVHNWSWEATVVTVPTDLGVIAAPHASSSTDVAVTR